MEEGPELREVLRIAAARSSIVIVEEGVEVEVGEEVGIVGRVVLGKVGKEYSAI